MNRKLYEAVPATHEHQNRFMTCFNSEGKEYYGVVRFRQETNSFTVVTATDPYVIDISDVLVAVEEVDKWISVSERNPENIGLYEVYCNDGSHLMAHVNVVGWWTIPFGNYSGDMGPKFVRDSKEVEREVTHWKFRNPSPLPSAPKQDRPQ